MINRVMIEGNITDHIDLRQTQSGKFVCSFSIANNDGYGENQHTEFVNVTAWDKTAEAISRYCQKGTRILVDGKWRTEVYEKDGQKKYTTKVIAQNVEFLSKTKDDAQTTLTREDGKDMFGRKPTVDIEPEDLPFY